MIVLTILKLLGKNKTVKSVLTIEKLCDMIKHTKEKVQPTSIKTYYINY